MFRWIMQGVYPTYNQTQRLNVILHDQVMIYGSMDIFQDLPRLRILPRREGGAYDGIKGILI